MLGQIGRRVIWSRYATRTCRFSTVTNGEKEVKPVLTIGDVLKEREEAKLKSNDGTIANFETWESIASNSPVTQAVDLMVSNNVGSLIVTEENRGVVGIVTERDVLTRISPESVLSDDLLVSSIMSSHIMCIQSSTTVMDALASMSKKRFRHFAVIREEMKDTVTGDTVPEDAMRCVLSISDIIKSYARQSGSDQWIVDNDKAVMTAATLLREKARKFKLILNTRMDDEVTIAQAVEEMATHNIGSVVIVDDDQAVQGIFTERDYLRKVVFEKKDPRTMILQDECTRDVFCLNPEHTLQECVQVCATKPFRHFPVVDSKNAIYGMLSIKDIVKEISKGHDDTPGFWLMEFFRSKIKKSEEVPEKNVATSE